MMVGASDVTADLEVDSIEIQFAGDRSSVEERTLIKKSVSEHKAFECEENDVNLEQGSAR